VRLQVGDSVAVRFVNVWNPQKLATFSGICIARRGGILRASFTLRNHIDGYAMEQQFPLNSPLLRGIRVIKVRALRVHARSRASTRVCMPAPACS
jgi:large subunit ribosomal protein L19